jgi:hypothetical protein
MRAGLPAVLADRDRVRALTEGAKVAGLLPVQLYLLAAGRGAPSARNAAEFVAACTRAGWRAVPAGLEPPKPGDLFVLTGETRQPERVGIVGPLDTGGEYFIGLLDGERARRGMREADFWLRAPG